MKPGLLMLPSAVSDSRVHNILPNRIETDFQFSRASAATRVNHQGLIENVGYFSDELVQNGDFSELGPEIIVNGDFATDSDWSLGAGWTISNGKLRADNVSLINTFQAYVYTSGKTYKVTYTISDYVKGAMRIQFGGGGSSVNGPKRNANGTYTDYLTATNNHTSVRIRALSDDGGFTGSVDNVSVKQVDPNNRWTLGGSAWSITDKLSADGTQTAGTNSYQSQTFDNSKTYKVVFSCTIQAGNLDVRLQGGGSTVVGTTHTTSGTYTQLLTSTGNTSLRFRGNADFIGSISSVSAVEVQGDKPRLDYDPINPTCPHLLLEPQSTNLIKFSENFNNGWSVNQTTLTANSGVCPDGTNNAFNLVANAANSVHLLATTISSTNLRTISIFAKQNGYKRFRFNTGSSSNGFASFDLSNGTVAGSGGTFFNSAKIQPLANNWYRCSLTINSGGGTNPTIAMEDDAGNVTFLGDGISGLLIWGAQLEELSYPTSYIPTAGSTETRVGETCTNAGNVDTFNSTEGVLYAEIAALSNDQTNRRITLSDGTNTNRIVTGYNTTSNQIFYFVVVGNSTVASGNYTSSDITEFSKIAIKYKVNDFALWVDGTKKHTDLSGAVFSADTLNSLQFEQGAGNALFFYGKVKGLATYNRALTDTELYTITSTQYSAYSGMVAALGNYTIPC